ncbi:OmpA family protein [Burkholderiaceae bacterium UC74_6]
MNNSALYQSAICKLSLAAVPILMLGACSTTPLPNAQLTEARAGYRQAESNESVRLYASPELHQAGDALERANAAWGRDERTDEVNHLAYLAKQRVALAQATGRQRAAEMSLSKADADRDAMRLSARTDEANDAKTATATAQSEMIDAQHRAMNSAQDADQARQSSRDAQARSVELESQLRNINAKKTDHGMVITLNDVLFDTNRSELRPDAMRSFDKLAVFMKRHPQRQASVDGYTDNVGSSQSNQSLATRRADAVRSALIEMGVDGDRLATRSYGKAFPVADNGSSQGRQLNRRVEIVLSDDAGLIQQR